MEADQLADLIDQASRVDGALGKALTRAERRIASEQRRNIPVRSGINKDRIKVTRIGPLEGVVGTDEPQGERLELGTATRPPIPWALSPAEPALDSFAAEAAEIIQAMFE